MTECTGHNNELYQCLECGAHFQKFTIIQISEKLGKQICPFCGSEEIQDVIKDVKLEKLGKIS